MRAPKSLVAAVLGVCTSVTGGAAPIEPDWGEAGEPRFAPGSTAWHRDNVTACPVLYRREVVIPPGAKWVAGRLTASVCAYVYVDGVLVAEFTDRPARRDRPAVEINWPVDLDLTPWLSPGRHTVAISSTPAGIHLDMLVGTEAPGVRLSTDATWRVQKFPPLTMIRREPCMATGFDVDDWFGVKEKPAPAAITWEEAERTAMAQSAVRAEAEDAETRWRLEMLRTRGWAVRNWETRGFGGPERVGRAWRELAASQPVLAAGTAGADAVTGAVWLDDERTLFSRLSEHYEALGRQVETRRAREGVAVVTKALAESRTAMDRTDWGAANHVIDQALRELENVRQTLGKQTGAPVNALNRAYHNRVGWIDVPALLDNHVQGWGLRLNPIEVSWKLDLAGRWRFRLDPDNRGLQDTVHTFGYNIDNQWDEITVPGVWEGQGYQAENPNHPADNPFAATARTDGPYNGYAWYRKTLQVPAEWAGHDLELCLGVVDDFDWTYFNGKEVGATGRDQERWWRYARVYRIPKDNVFFGQHNVIAVRVYDEADKGGIVQGPVELRCPGLREAYEQRPAAERPPSTVIESPLFPSALVTIGTAELPLSGWLERSLRGPAAVVMQIDGTVESRRLEGNARRIYDANRDGELSANWLCLWPSAADREAGELPLQVVCERPPSGIAADLSPRGVRELVLQFDEPGRWVQLIRPLRSPAALGEGPSEPDVETLTFWSRACLAYPVAYAEASERRGDKLGITDLYSYRMLRDAWGTEPLQLALLPPLASFAVAVKWPGLSLGDGTRALGYSLGEWGALMGVVGADRIDYEVPIDPLPRLAGLTDYCFGGTDIGGPGNLAEVRQIGIIGSNSWRPQSNNLRERMQTTITLANRHGLNLMTNVDNRFGATDAVFTDYRALAEWVMAQKLPAHAVAYDLINEPANMTPEVYNPRIARLVKTIREVDPVHPIYIETPHSYASVSQFINLAPVDTPNVVYSFHDYAFRLEPRWPNAERDRRNLLRQWLPAFRYSIQHSAPIHLGEFGGFHQTPYDPWHNRATLSLLDDMFGIFDQFGWHFHYYSNRGEWSVRTDGSLDGSLVHDAFERYFARNTLNVFHQPEIRLQ